MSIGFGGSVAGAGFALAVEVLIANSYVLISETVPRKHVCLPGNFSALSRIGIFDPTTLAHLLLLSPDC